MTTSRWIKLAVIVLAFMFPCSAGLTLLYSSSVPDGSGRTNLKEITPDVIGSSLPSYTHVAIIGDSYTTGTREGGIGRLNWTAVMAENVQTTPPLALTIRAQGGVGYVQKPAGKLTYPELVDSAVNSTTELAIFVGTRNDRDYANVEMEAANSFQRVKVLSPSCKIVVVGPIWPVKDPPDSVLRDRDQVRQAANKYGAIWIDPIEERWFVPPGRLIGSDKIHPTDAGHRYLAQKIELAIRPILENN